MHIVFKSIDKWFEQEPNLKEKFTHTYRTIYNGAHDYALHMNKMAEERVSKSAEIVISEPLLKQSLIDAFDDLLRLKNYHPTSKPNPIKEMAYIVYWLLKHKPIHLISEDIVLNERLSNMAKTRFLFINEEFGVKLLLNSAFEGKKLNNQCSHMHKEADNQLKYFKQFLLYYLVYRLDSPKSLEATMLGCTIHPVWEVNPVIWSEPEKPSEDF